MQGCVVESALKFLDHAARTLDILRGEMPDCCKKHVILGISWTAHAMRWPHPDLLSARVCAPSWAMSCIAVTRTSLSCLRA